MCFSIAACVPMVAHEYDVEGQGDRSEVTITSKAYAAPKMIPITTIRRASRLNSPSCDRSLPDDAPSTHHLAPSAPLSCVYSCRNEHELARRIGERRAGP